MSISASLDVAIASKPGYSITSSEIISILAKNGWKIKNENKILYLPLGDDDDFDWQEDQITESEFYEIAKQKQNNNEVIGVGMIWENTSIGGTLLVYPDHKISFSLSINLKTISNGATDVNWYLDKILPYLESDLTTIETFSFIQSYVG